MTAEPVLSGQPGLPLFTLFLLLDHGHSVCALSVSFSGSYQLLWSGSLPQYIVCLEQNMLLVWVVSV